MALARAPESGWARLWSARARGAWAHTASPEFFRRSALVTVWALAIGIVSGGAVRLTGSGLGCKDWPACTRTSVVAPLAYHAWVEFGNRLVEAALTVGIALVAVAAYRRRPRRRDLVWLALALLGGMFGEVVLGGEVVLHKLAPAWVMGHFWLSMALLVVAVVLFHRSRLADVTAGQPAGRATVEAARCLVRRGQLVASRAMLAWTFVVVALGTVVTGTGPHAGAPGVPRFHFLSLYRAAQLHGSSVEVLLALTVFTLWWMHRSRVDRALLRRAEMLLVVLVSQAAVGYTQYFTGDPVVLVGFHLAGATTVVVAMCWFNFGLFARRGAEVRAGVETSSPDAVSEPELVST
ncbi:MAG: COX15/CtaA family protein [Actinomycetota bacterium]|jgi:cytochrome c oxidase assembly protein subunit 15|nr:COX15/CtaA family protein [Actinomycetota bacterium]